MHTSIRVDTQWFFWLVLPDCVWNMENFNASRTLCPGMTKAGKKRKCLWGPTARNKRLFKVSTRTQSMGSFFLYHDSNRNKQFRTSACVIRLDNQPKIWEPLLSALNQRSTVSANPRCLYPAMIGLQSCSNRGSQVTQMDKLTSCFLGMRSGAMKRSVRVEDREI